MYFINPNLCVIISPPGETCGLRLNILPRQRKDDDWMANIRGVPFQINPPEVVP
jgi:hypothetical protein